MRDPKSNGRGVWKVNGETKLQRNVRTAKGSARRASNPRSGAFIRQFPPWLVHPPQVLELAQHASVGVTPTYEAP